MGIGLPKLPRFTTSRFNFSSFTGKRTSGGASYGSPKKASSNFPGNASPWRPLGSMTPSNFNTSPKRQSYKSKPVIVGKIKLLLIIKKALNYTRSEYGT